METREIEKFLNREILACASYLISELMTVDKFQEELWEMQALDYDAAVYDYVFNNPNIDDVEVYCTGERIDFTTDKELYKYLADNDKFADFCEDLRLEPEEREIFEYWIITDYLGRKLQGKGEAVLFNFYGLTIWGRTTTGQAIALDGVIQRIFEELN